MTHQDKVHDSFGMIRRVFIILIVICYGLFFTYPINAQVVTICAPDRAPTDAIKFRFNFFVAKNSGHANAHPKIKLICGTFRLWSGIQGSPAEYMIEANLYSSRWMYKDHTGPPAGLSAGLQGEEIFDQASLRMAIPDYIRKGLTGSKTFAPLMFPRQTYNIDYISGLYKTDMMSQTNLNGREGIVEIERAGIITDHQGWKYSGLLAPDRVFRQWNAAVTLDGIRYTMAFAVPNEHGQYLCPNEMPTLGGEFLANPGTFQVFYWGFEFQRFRSTRWEPVKEWIVCRDDHLSGTVYGVRVVPFRGRYVMEISNSGGSPDYLPLGTRFSIPIGNLINIPRTKSYMEK